MQIRCPHCRHPVEVIETTRLDDVTCPTCGSNISLVNADSTEVLLRQPKRIGHFELLTRVGAGAFGAVWKARDTVLDRIVALKVPRQGQLTASEIDFFFRDARAAAQLRHPKIVTVHEVGRDGDAVFIASEFIDGVNLQEWLSAKRLTVRESAELIAEVAEAVHHAHQRGVIHRDLKPGNILMEHDGRPHVADFGMAKRESGEITMTLDGQVLGTPAYMSPEQARGKSHEATAASDIYSLGVILYELLTDELPFRGAQRMLLLQIVKDEPPSPRKLNSHIPKDVETICLKAMSKEPVRRYAQAAEMAADLRRYLAGQPVLARPVGPARRAWSWCRRNPTVASLAGAVVLSLTLGIVISTLFALQARDREAEAVVQQTRAERETARADDRAAEAQRRQREAEEARDRADEALSVIESMMEMDDMVEFADHARSGGIFSFFFSPKDADKQSETPKQLGSRLRIVIELRLAVLADQAHDFDRAADLYRSAAERLAPELENIDDLPGFQLFAIAHAFARAAKAFSEEAPARQPSSEAEPSQSGLTTLAGGPDNKLRRAERRQLADQAKAQALLCLKAAVKREKIVGDMFKDPFGELAEDFSALRGDPFLESLLGNASQKP